jgi:hypothetical protein
MRGSDFLRSLPTGGDPRSVVERERLVPDAVSAGPTHPIVGAPPKTTAGGHIGRSYMATNTLGFGGPGPKADPGDCAWVRVAVTPDTAHRFVHAHGVRRTSQRIADLAPAQADVRLTPHTQPPVPATTATLRDHHAGIEEERAGREGLLATIGKEWILGPEVFPAHSLGQDGAMNCGWHTRRARHTPQTSAAEKAP